MDQWESTLEDVERLMGAADASPVEPDPAFWRARRLLVTGATGVVGSRVVQHAYSAGASVVALVRDPDARSDFYRSGVHQHVAIVQGQLEDFHTLERAINEHEVDIVIHLAAQTIVGTAERFPLATFEANIRGTYNLLEACRIHRGLVQRVVLASSDKAYGDHQDAWYDEQAPLVGNHPYDVSKTCVDLLARAYAHTYTMPISVARCGNIYGPGDLNWSRLVPGTIRSIVHGQRPVLRSDGTYVRDFLHVDDAAAAYLLLAKLSDREGIRGQAFNFGGESPQAVRSVVDLIGQLMDRPDLDPIVLGNATNEIPHQALATRKARETLGWGPRFDLNSGLPDTIAWYRAFLMSSDHEADKQRHPAGS